MSFLSSVLSSIESGKPASIPPPAPVTPRSPAAGSSSATNKTDSRKTTPVSRDGSQKPTIAPAGTKRKAEEQLQRPDRANGQIQSKNATMKTATSHTSAAVKPRPAGTGPGGAAKPGEKPSTPAAMAASRPVAPAATTSKPPPKGSFADLMMKAKAAQEKAPVKVGMFKHQAVPKEKLSKSERKKRAMEALAKEKETKAGKKPGVTAGLSAGAKTGVRPGEERAPKRRGPDEIEYKGTARPTQTTTYKGTAGLPPRRASNDPRGRSASRHGKPTRRDEYLGTDEEDEGDYEDDYDDYYSDESSDMEAGLMDVEEEEAAALRAAKKEDEEDIRAEMAAKREKLERRMKLAHLAKSRR